MSAGSFEEILLGLLVALAAGALIGLERQQTMTPDRTHSIGGVRTFPLIALAGALSALASHTMGVWPIFGALLVIGIFAAASHYQEWSREKAPGITTEVAALVTFLLGVMALLPDLPLETEQRYLLIGACAGVTMALLSFKKPLHEAVERISNDDIYATAKFVILALIVLPALPNRTFGPLEVLNPFEIGVMIVLVAGISFVGYIATRIGGNRKGLMATGVLGGMVSSTAVTVSLSTRVREAPKTAALAGVGILTASATMFLRILVVVGIVDLKLVPILIWPIGLMAAVGYGAALALYRRSRPKLVETKPVSHRNPFELGAALKFGLLFAVVIVVTKAAQVYLGDRGLYASSVLSGVTDVDAITLSVSRFHREGLAPLTATIAITLAAVTNTVAKLGIAAWLGGRELAILLIMGLGASVVVGCLALALAR